MSFWPFGSSEPPPAPKPLPPVRMDGALMAVRYASLAVIGGYTIGLLYRLGFARRVLPAAVNDKLESAVEAVKERTKPIGDAARFALVRQHLIRTYGWATTGMVTLAAGVLLFCRYPRVPIVIPVAASVVPALLFIAIPRHLMAPAARVLCFYTSLLSAGYALGPIGWAAQDSLVVFVMLSGCTMVGLCVPLFLTRGMISYVLSAQLLACALSLSLVTAPKQSKDYSPFKLLKAQAGVQVILNGDVNVLLTMQLISNVGITALHTLPYIYKFVSWKDSEEQLIASVDPLLQAFCITAGWAYVGYRLVRSCVAKLVKKIFSDERARNGSGGAGQGSWSLLMNGQVDGLRVTDGVTGLMMVLWYVKAVSLLQHSDPTETLESVRYVFQRISPLPLLLGRAGSS